MFLHTILKCTESIKKIRLGKKGLGLTDRSGHPYHCFSVKGSVDQLCLVVSLSNCMGEVPVNSIILCHTDVWGFLPLL